MGLRGSLNSARARQAPLAQARIYLHYSVSSKYAIKHIVVHVQDPIALSCEAMVEMAQYDLTSVIGSYLDRHLVFPMLEFLSEKKVRVRVDDLFMHSPSTDHAPSPHREQLDRVGEYSTYRECHTAIDTDPPVYVRALFAHCTRSLYILLKAHHITCMSNGQK